MKLPNAAITGRLIALVPGLAARTDTHHISAVGSASEKISGDCTAAGGASWNALTVAQAAGTCLRERT